MSEKAIYLHHERDTMTNLFSDLGTREMGYGEDDDYIGFKDEDSNERWLPTFATNVITHSGEDLNFKGAGTFLGNLGVGSAPISAMSVFGSFSWHPGAGVTHPLSYRNVGGGLDINTNAAISNANDVFSLKESNTVRFVVKGNGFSSFGTNGPKERVDVNGSLNVEGAGTFGDILTVGEDTDKECTFGRTVLGGVAVDYAALSHYDHVSLTNYSLLQSDTGETFLNSASGGTTRFRINNADVAQITADAVNIANPLNVTGAGTFGGDVLLDTAEKRIYFDSTTYNIYVKTDDGMNVNSPGNLRLISDDVIIGEKSGDNIDVSFDTSSNDGLISWVTSDDYFRFSDDILMNSTEQLYFASTAHYLFGSGDNINAVGSLNVTGAGTIGGALHVSGIGSVAGIFENLGMRTTSTETTFSDGIKFGGGGTLTTGSGGTNITHSRASFNFAMGARTRINITPTGTNTYYTFTGLSDGNIMWVCNYGAEIANIDHDPIGEVDNGFWEVPANRSSFFVYNGTNLEPAVTPTYNSGA